MSEKPEKHDVFAQLSAKIDELVAELRAAREPEFIDVKWAELHAPLFLAGANLSAKLNPKDANRSSLKMRYDRTHKELHVTFNGARGILPASSVLSMVDVEDERAPEKPQVIQHTPRPGFTAQVSTPQSHVFAGAGHGKSR